MATMNVGGRTVEVPNSLNPADAPDTLRAAGPGARPNSFGDAASNAQAKTPAPQLRLPAPEVAKPLFGPHDPVYHGDGRYGAPPNPGATNATAGATQTAGAAGVGNVPPNSAGAPVAQPTGVGGNPGAGVQGDVKRGGLRGVWDSTKAGASTLGGYGKTAVSTLATPKGVGGVAGVVEGYNQLRAYNKLAATPGVTEDQLQRQAIEGGAATIARGAVTAGGAALGGAVGSLAGPAGTAVGAVAGGTLADAGFDNARDRLASAGQALGKGEFGDATKAFFGFPGSYGPVSDGARAQAAAAQPAGAAPASLRTPTQDPLRVQEARNNIADPGRADVPLPPEKLREMQDLQNPMSNASLQAANPGGQVQKTVGPDGRVTYSGTKVSGDVSFTNADGKALPGQAGGGFIRGSGDGSFRADGGLRSQGGYQPQPQPQVSIMRDSTKPSWMKDNGVAEAIKVASGGKGVRHISGATMRAILGNDVSLRNTESNNATSRANNANTNDTTLRTNAATNATSRANTQDNNATSRYGADAPGRIAQRKLEFDLGRRDAVLRGATNAKGGVDYVKAQELDVRLGGDGKQYADIITSAQNAASKTQDLRKGSRDALAGEIVVPVRDKDGRATGERDKAAEAATVAGIRQMFPGAQDADLLENMAHYKGEYELAQAVNGANRGQKGFGLRGDLLPSYNAARPTFSGAVPENYFDGLGASNATGWSFGADKGDVNLRDNSLWEQNFNLGNLSEDARAAMYRRTNRTQKESK